MFGSYFRPYIPGLWVDPQDSTPGFNVNYDTSPTLLTEQTDAQPTDVAPGAEHEFGIQAAPFTDLPDFRLYPPFELPNFNVESGGSQSGATSGTDVTQPGVVATPDPASGRQVAPPVDVPGFRLNPANQTPGFNVPSDNDVPGFDVDDDSAWSAAPPNMPPGSIEERPTRSDPILSGWPYDIVIPPLPTSIDPLTGQRIALDRLPGVAPIEAPGAGRAPSSVGQQISNATIGSRTAIGHQYNSQPSHWDPWLNTLAQPREGSWIHSPGVEALSTNPLVRLPAASNFMLSHTGSAATPVSQPATPLQQYQIAKTSASPRPMTMRPVETPGTSMTPIQRERAPNFSKPEEGHQGFGESLNRRPAWASPLPTSPVSDNKAVYSPNNDQPSLAQQLAESTADTIVPGAYYQKLARQQLEEKHYLGAGVYQAAALVDAALGVATFGLSTRAAAASRVVARKGANLFLRSFDSLGKLKWYLKKPPEGMEWHHIVEKNQADKFGQKAVQSIDNIVAISKKEHDELSAFYASKRPFSEPFIVRKWLGENKGFEEQYEFGMEQIKRILGY